MREYIKRTWRNLSQLRLVQCNDWRTFTMPLGKWRSMALIFISFSRMPMEDYTIYGTFMLFGYGFQIQKRGRYV